MDRDFNTANFISVMTGGATAFVSFAATLPIPREKLWIAALIGAVVCAIAFFVPSHSYRPNGTQPVNGDRLPSVKGNGIPVVILKGEGDGERGERGERGDKGERGDTGITGNTGASGRNA